MTLWQLALDWRAHAVTFIIVKLWLAWDGLVYVLGG
jgi:hypothetical protein